MTEMNEATDKPNAPEKEILFGVECFVYPAEQYAAVDADVADERKDGRSAGAVARQMSLWAGIRSADNLRWMLDEMLADANRASFKTSMVEGALKGLLRVVEEVHHSHVDEAEQLGMALMDGSLSERERAVIRGRIDLAIKRAARLRDALAKARGDA